MIIAIDGHSSCGKSTLARRIAHKLGYLYIDSGAMYRAVTLYLIRQKVNIDDRGAVAAVLKNIEVQLIPDSGGGIVTFLNGENVEDQIRSMEVSQQVSKVSAIPEVRTYLVRQQRAYGKEGGVVMDGRDIGTVVFPDATLKIFLTAGVAERARRRYKELVDEGQAITYEEVLANVKKRDHIDTTRPVSPLKQATDAIVIDNTNMDANETMDTAMRWVNKRKAEILST